MALDPGAPARSAVDAEVTLRVQHGYSSADVAKANAPAGLLAAVQALPEGRKLCFIGNNMDAAKMSGIRVKLNRITYYAISGLLAGLAGIVLCSRVTSSNPTAGTGYEMNAIAAVVVGGNSASGGSGSILRTVIGAIVIGVMGNALNILGFSTNYQLIVKGALIVLAVALDIISKKIKK